MAKQLVPKELYGGAIRCCLPAGMFDVSNIREVANTQEVFAHPRTDESIIFDILEYQQIGDEDAARLHFEQIAECNSATPAAEILSVTPLSDAQMPKMPGIPKFVIEGQQAVAKFNEGPFAANTVFMFVVLVRLPAHETDIVVTFNLPTHISGASSSIGLEAGARSGDRLTRDDVTAIVQSFEVVDYGLFG